MRSDLFAAGLAASLLLGACASREESHAAAAGAPLSTPASDAAALVKALPATGEARRCLTTRQITQMRPVDDQTILFRTGANRRFRNDLKAGCPGLAADRTLRFRTSIGQHCEMDIFDIIDTSTGMTFGSCSLGAFTPVDLPKGLRF
ncbi:DUF6491 family protein [Sandaracinobacteroides sp. A072]|uniref:DUF6491 family protein n=1 Tax=Sandaracinobacteroides sp. A072 TaxID=3461146 RepID=UPI0040411543